MKFFLFFLISFKSFALEITGKAFDKNQLIYTEKHLAVVNGQGLYETLTTEYLDNNNALFAKVKSQFVKNKFIPDYTFEDLRTSYKENVSLLESGNKISIEINEKGKSKKNILEVSSGAILSQGFHNYIITNMEAIKKSKQEIYFIVTKKNDQYRFDIETQKISDGKITIIIRPANIFLKRILDPIKLIYELSTNHLLYFEGLTNIDDSKGDSQSASIEYTYH